MLTLYTRIFWIDAFERAVKTIAQTLLSLWAMGQGLDVFTINWKQALGVSLGAAVISLLTSIISAAKNNTDTASLVVDTKPL